MGLSASQARLLSITARLSNNELQSQQIANSKVRLSNRTQEASAEYMAALSQQSLVYTTYNEQGEATQASLTAGLIYTYGDLKNQYGITNTAGQLLVSSTDATNFESSTNMSMFLQKCGVELFENPEYASVLTLMYGEQYLNYLQFDENGAPVDNIEAMGFDIKNWVSQPDKNMTLGEYTTWKNNIQILSSVNTDKGSYGELITKLKSVPEYPGTEPVEPTMPTIPDFSALATSYNGSACYNDVVNNSSSKDTVYHIEHNLCNLIWGENGFGLDENGDITSITNSNKTITITPNGSLAECKNSLTKGFGGSGVDAAKDLLAGMKQEDIATYDCVEAIKQHLIDLYCDAVYYLKENKYSINTSAFEMQTSSNVKTADELKASWNAFYEELANLQNVGTQEAIDKHNDALNQYRDAHEYWESAWKNIQIWSNSCTDLYAKYLDDLKNVPLPMIPDDGDSKGNWYINLWHRMNGESEYKSPEGQNGQYYKKLDDNLLNSKEWLQFALEHGVVTLEQVKYVDKAENETGLKNVKWTSTSYASCADISSVDDDRAIALAEAQYTKKLNEIEAKDKKYDTDIKKLDTEHSALQTEYDSVKSVIDKNAERSFKAFS